MDRLSALRVVLCEVGQAGNLGAVARVMKNMGLSDLALVAPRVKKTEEEARVRAVHADDLLDSAREFDNLAAALEDCTSAYAFSARPRYSQIKDASVFETFQSIAEMPPSCTRVALVFGNEQSGLRNDQVALCSGLCYIPTARYAALNLSQAVCIATYEARRALSDESGGYQSNEKEGTQMPARLATVQKIPLDILSLMVQMNFCEAESDKARHSFAKLQRVFHGADLSQGEADLIMGFLRYVRQRISTD